MDCTGLMMPARCKSVAPLAAVTAPSHVCTRHQFLLFFLGQASWSDEALMGRVCYRVLLPHERRWLGHGPDYR